MTWTPLLLALLSHCTGSLSQPVLTQPPSLSASLGETVRLTCTLSSGYNVGSYRITWYQQKPGSPPRYLLNYHTESDKGQGSGVPSRFSGSKDASANAGILTISGLQPEDEADYYCATAHGRGSSYRYPQCLRGGGSETKTSKARGDDCLPFGVNQREPTQHPLISHRSTRPPGSDKGLRSLCQSQGPRPACVLAQPPPLPGGYQGTGDSCVPPPPQTEPRPRIPAQGEVALWWKPLLAAPCCSAVPLPAPPPASGRSSVQ
ncbi:uncharacterized protein LOC118725711 [Pipistrellus kuhlii]|uniref:uncharacterized protein LOC118725711 n=1 Tax=Pipistrellus kuhlii TaxID=59472 RepID=UPI001E273DF9|nr:uncharacterized protein LOC118725711 [Pipistrellus kuhlii]